MKDEHQYVLPPIELLNPSPKTGAAVESQEELEAKARYIELLIQQIGIKVNVCEVVKDDIVTSFRLDSRESQLSKLILKNQWRIESLLASKYDTRNVNIVMRTTPSRSITIETYNDDAKALTLRDVIESEAFKNSHEKIGLALGRYSNGREIVIGLSEMAHGYVTGTATKACIDNILISTLYRATPRDIRFVIINSKDIGLREYEKLPHMLMPIARTAQASRDCLRNVVDIINEREQILAASNVDSFSAFNDLVAAETHSDGKMRAILVIVNEYFDVDKSEFIKAAISQISKRGGRVGIHLVFAKQLLPSESSGDALENMTEFKKWRDARDPSYFFAQSEFAVELETKPLYVFGSYHRMQRVERHLWHDPSLRIIQVHGCVVTDAEVKRVCDFIIKRCTGGTSGEGGFA